MSTEQNQEKPPPEKLTNKFLAEVRTGRTFRSNSSNQGTKKPKISSLGQSASVTNLREYVKSPVRAKSATPLHALSQQQPSFPRKQQLLFNGMDSAPLMKQRLKHYNLDFVEDAAEHTKNVFDPKSQWFCRDVVPDYKPEDYFPHQTETHLDQARYLCHILVNLYIAISSKDIQGLLNISSKELAQFKSDIDNLTMNTDMFRLADVESSDMEDNASAFDDSQAEYDTVPDEDAAADEEGEELHDEEFDEPEFVHSGKITVKSSSIVNVNHWTNELRNCIHFDIPITLRKSLAVVYYYLALVRGQKVFRQLHTEVFELLVCTDYEGTNFTELLSEAGLILDYAPLLQLFEEYLPNPESDYQQYDIGNSGQLKLFKLMLKHAHNARPFFNKDDESILPYLMEFTISSFSPATLSIVSPIITSLLPYHFNVESNITDIFPFIFSVWKNAPITTVLDTHLYEVIGDVSQSAYFQFLSEENPRIVTRSHLSFGEYGLLNEGQFQFVINRIQNHLRNDFQIVSFSRTTKPLIYAINGSNSRQFFEQLGLLIQSIETFVHPSNSGRWTKICAKFIYAFIKAYHERFIFESKASSKYRTELKLNEETHSKLIETLIGTLLLGSQNKNTDIAHYYISGLAYLLNLKSQSNHLIYDKVLIDVYESLTDQYVNSIHRVFSSLKQFGRIVRFMVMDDLYRIHITNIMSMIVTKLDSNDPVLSNVLVNTIASISCYVPVETFVKEDEYITFESTTLPLIEQHLYYIKENGSSSGFPVANADLELAFRASTSVFEAILTVYADKLFSFVDADLEEYLIFKINQTTMLMIESMSKELFDKFVRTFDRLFWDGNYLTVKKPNIDILGLTAGAIVKRDPHKYVRKFFDSIVLQINQELERGAGSVRSSKEVEQRDVKLVAMLNVLSEIFRHSHAQLLEIKSEILALLKKIYTSITNPPIDIITSLLLHNLLSSLTTTEIVDYNLFQKEAQVPINEKWGAYQFNEKKFEKQNMNFEWHIPTSAEVDFAIQIMKTFLELSQTQLSEIISNPVHDTKQTDTLRKYILILTHTLSGGCLLFDPEFNKELKQHKFTSNLGEKLLLWKNVKSNNIDDESVENFAVVKDNGEDDDLSIEEDDEMVMEKNFLVEVIENEDVMMEDFDSAMPSGMGTPGPGDHYGSATGNMSLMSSEFTFRELSVYTINYFFGATRAQKFSDKRYEEVHKLRSDVGLLFHKIATFLKEHYENNTNILQIFLHGLKVWFTDVGQETIFNEDPTACLDYDFLESLQSLAHVTDTYTRTFIASRIQYFYQTRVYLRSTNRVPSKMEKTLLNDIVDLSTSVYPNVAKSAQACLFGTMRQLTGSYRYVVENMMNFFDEALTMQNELKLESILSAMSSKKFLSKIYNDYKNISRVINLLLKASLTKHHEVSQTASRLLALITTSLKIPSSVCLIDMQKMETINPGDEYIALQVEIVQKAKEAKRNEYMDLLVDLRADMLNIFEKDQKTLPWKHSLIFIEILTKLQSNMEFSIDEKTVVKLFEQTEQLHPSVVFNATNSIMDIVNRIFLKSDLCYNISNKFDPNFHRKFVEILDTKQPNFASFYQKEMENFQKPKFFIDNKTYVGFFSWGRELKVVKNVTQLDISTMRESDKLTLQKIGSMINKDYLKKYTDFLVSENEGKGSFSHQNVDFIVMIIHFIEIGFTTDISYTDVLELSSSIFDKYDKAKIIMSAEIFCGIILASKLTAQMDLVKRDDFLNKYMDDLFDKNMNKDTLEVFQVVFWWLPNHVDMRRCYPVFVKLTSLEDVLLSVEQNSVEHGIEKLTDEQSSLQEQESVSYPAAASGKTEELSPSLINARVSLFRHMVMSMNHRTPFIDVFANKLVFDYPYELVRRGISNCINLMMICDCMRVFDNVSDMIAYIAAGTSDGLGNSLKVIPEWFDTLFVNEMEVINKIYCENEEFFKTAKPQDIVKHEFYYRSNTMYHLIFGIITNSIVPIGKYLSQYVVPFLDRLYLMKDVCKLGNIYPDLVYMHIAKTPMDRLVIEDVLANLLHNDQIFNTPHGIRVQMTFFEKFYSQKMFLLRQDEKLEILNYFVDNLYNAKSLEVRMKSSEVLSGIIHTISLHENGNLDQVITKLITKFETKLGADLKLKEKQKIIKGNPKNVIEIHGSIIGLGALIAAFPYISPLPKWIPQVLSNLSSWAKVSGIVGSSSKDIISNFKKIRSDTWHIDRESFTTDELENLEGVNWRSYYA